nr:transposase [Burkholderia territorii]
MLFFLPAYSPELNMIEIVWRQLKYRWRRFVTWTKETIDAELADLLRGYGSFFSNRFLVNIYFINYLHIVNFYCEVRGQSSVLTSLVIKSARDRYFRVMKRKRLT